MVVAKKTGRMDLKLAIILMFIFCSIHTVIALSFFRSNEKFSEEGLGVLLEDEISSRSKRDFSRQPTTAPPKETKEEATEVEPCPCENGGDCLRRTPIFCVCKFGYHGEICQFYIGESGEWPAVNCGQYLFGKTEGKITSPFYPRDYRNNHRCYYVIATPGAQTIKLIFNRVNIEKDFDYIVIGKGHQFDWPSRIYEVSGEFHESTIPAPIEIDSDRVWIYFYSDFVNVDSGFQITFMADVDACESNPCPSGSLCQDFKYNYQCKDIMTAPGCSCLNGGSCIGKDSNGAEFCACPSGRQGDMCELTISPPSNCGENYYGEEQGQIVSPNYPMEYENRLNCYYHIGVPGAKSIRIIYNAIDIERHRDEFIIYSGSWDAVSNMIVLYTDSLAVMPAQLDIKGDRALVNFYTDSKGVRTGFNISFIADIDSCLSNPCAQGLECIDDDFTYECLKKPEEKTSKITEANEEPTTIVTKPLISTTTPVFLVPTPLPAVGYCTVWSQKYYRTFDGKHFIFDSTCSLVLAKDCQDLGLFSIYLSTEQCAGNTCNQRLTIELDTDNGMTTLQLRKEGNQAVVVVDYNVDEFLTESSTVNGVEVLFVSGWVVVSSPIGFNVIWDGMSRYTVDMTSEELYGGLCGLCGNYNEDQEDDFSSPEGSKQVTAERFGRSWKTDDQEGSCYDESRRCTDSIGAMAQTEYMSVCEKLRGGVFQSCNEKVDVTPFIEACNEYMCDCVLASGSDAGRDVVLEECSCNAFSAYSSACAWQQEVVEWRTPDNCPLQCPDGMEYQICGSTCPQTCGNQVVECENDYCIEGCHCPSGQVLVDNKCIAPSGCPCEFNGHQIQPGRVMRDDISECVCTDGKWECSEYDSPGRCWLAGADHFKSFDGKHFDFTGDCEYVLVTDCPSLENDFSVNVQNYGCSQFGTSCSRVLIIMIGTTRVRVRSTEILVNDEDVKKLPAEYNGVLIERPATSVAKVTLSNGLQVEITEDYRVTITAPSSLKNNLCGLCGTFNGNQEDDFYTKSGDIETTAQSFGSKWQTSAFCDTPAYHFNFCMLHQQHVSFAVEKCAVFKMANGPFSECLSVLDPEAYYHACMSQVCGCKTSECSCTIIEQYAVDCSAKGVVPEWRDSVPACAVACEGDLVYHECASTCGSSCASLSSGFPCHPGCVPGCACPEGKVLDQDGSCVAPSECPCPSDNGLVSPGFVYQSPCGPCECTNGSFTCEKEDCSDECGNNMVFSTCKPSQSKTCANMESHNEQLPGQCVPGCVCQDGFVFDENVMECVAPDNCPCQHGGNLYKKGEDIMIGCNKCTCMGTSWECEEKECPGICTAWGDPHFTSFDGKRFDLHGDCDYELATNLYKKQDDGHEPFRVVIKNVPCGVAGVTCTKSVKFTIGSGRDKDKVHLVRGKPIHVTTRNPDRIRVSEVGLYVFVHTNIGVTLIWDKGTWIQVKLDPYYKGQVSGLCGNYNGNQNDDFTKRSGMAAISATEFGYSWRLHNYCVESKVIQSACSLYPARELWARRKCAILKSDVFRPCHSVVSPDLYVQQCVNDACNCNGGTGCEKLCTAISAYAHQCSAMKVSISWRNQNLCPIQCQGCQEYKPCIGVCNACENKFRLMSQDDGSDQCPDTCVEGCACPEGKFMQNGECVDMCDVLPTQSSFQGVTEKMVSLSTKPQVSDGKSSDDKCKSTCDKLYGNAFRPCHTTQSPILFYEICKQPAFLCNECVVLERYSQLCSVFGVDLVDWRASSMCEDEDKDKTTSSELLLSAATTLMTTQLPTTQAPRSNTHSSTTTVHAQTIDVKAPTTTPSEMQTTFTHAPTTTNLAPSTTTQTPFTTTGSLLATTQNATTQAPTTTIHTQPATTQGSTTITQRPSGVIPESTTPEPLVSSSMSTTTTTQAVASLGSSSTTQTPFSGSTTTVEVLLATNPESTTKQASSANASRSAITQPPSTTSPESLTATTRESSATTPYFTNITQPSSTTTVGSTTSSHASSATTLRSTTNTQVPSSTTSWSSTSTRPLSTTTSESPNSDQMLLLATTLMSTNTSQALSVTTQASSATNVGSTTTTPSSSATTVESITSSQASSAATSLTTSHTKAAATTIESTTSYQATSETTDESTTSSQASSVTTPTSTTTTTPSSSATTVESFTSSNASSADNPTSTSNTKASATTLESTTSYQATSGITVESTTSSQASSATTPRSTTTTTTPSSSVTTVESITSSNASSAANPTSTSNTNASATTLASTTSHATSATTVGSTTSSQASSATTPMSTTTTTLSSPATTVESIISSNALSAANPISTSNAKASATTLASTTSHATSATTVGSTTSSQEASATTPMSTTTTTLSSPATTVESIISSNALSAANPISTSNAKASATTLASTTSHATSATTVGSTTSSQEASSTTTSSSTNNTQSPSSTTSWSSTTSQPLSTTTSQSPTSDQLSLGTTLTSTTTVQALLKTTQDVSATTVGSTTTTTTSQSSSATALESATSFQASSTPMSTSNTKAPLSTTSWSTTNIQASSATTLEPTTSFMASSGPTSWSTTFTQAPSATTDGSTTSSRASSATTPRSTTNTQTPSSTTLRLSTITSTSKSPTTDRVTTMPALSTTAQRLSVTTQSSSAGTVKSTISSQASSVTIPRSTSNTKALSSATLWSTASTQTPSANTSWSTTSSQASSATTRKSTINTQAPLSTTSWSSTTTQPAPSTSSWSSTNDRVSSVTTPASTTTAQASLATNPGSTTNTQSSSAITLESTTSSHTSSATKLMSTTDTSAPLSATRWSTTSEVPSATTTWSTTSREAPSETTPRSATITQASSATVAEATTSSRPLSETTSESLTTAKSTTSCPDYCSDVYDAAFEPCHQFINPELYYLMCQAEHSVCSDCLILEAYASRCAQFGLNIQWRYGNCELTTPALKTTMPIVETSPTTECPNLCSELYSDRFKACHAIMNPDFFYASCQAAHASCSECSVLSTYAQICQNLGHCIEWTSDGLCGVDCPPGQEYRECICRDQEHCGGDVSCPAAMMVSKCTCPQGFEPVSGECQPCATTTPTLTPTTTTTTTTEFVCPESILSQCEHVMTDAFKPCHSFVDPEEFVQECKAACSNTCDLLESYANTCQSLHGMCLAWRNESICPVSCGSVFSYGGPVDLVFKQCVCPKQSCAEDTGSCFSSQLVSECTCPDGMQASGNVKEDGSCIACSKSGTCGVVTKVSEVKFDLDGSTCTTEVMSSQCSGRCTSGTGTVVNIFDSLLQITMIGETCNAEEVEKVEQTLRCVDGREITVLIENAVTCACGDAC